MKYSIQVFIITAFLLAFTASVDAVSFNNEKIEGNMLTDMVWSFDNPWGKEVSIYKDKLLPYIDNYGCRDATITMYAETPVTYYETVCSPSYKEVCKNDTKNNSIECYQSQVMENCKQVPKTVIERYDLDKTDYLLGEKDRIVIVAHRKAQTGFQSCDLNFNYDGDAYTDSVNTASFGKTWWNATWFYKVPFNATRTNLTFPHFPFRFIANNSQVNMSYCTQSDFRVVNSTEDGLVPFNLTVMNGTHIVAYINYSLLSSNFSGYIYCNASGVTSASQSLFFYGNPIDYDTFSRSDSSTLGATEYRGATYVKDIPSSEIFNSSLRLLINGKVSFLQNDTSILSQNMSILRRCKATNIDQSYDCIADYAGSNRRTLIRFNGASTMTAYNGSGTFVQLLPSWSANVDYDIELQINTSSNKYMNILINNSIVASNLDLYSTGAITKSSFGDFWAGTNASGVFFDNSYYLNNSVQGYASPSLSFGTYSTYVYQTVLNNGLLVNYVNRTNNTIQAGEEFMYYSIFSYLNGTHVDNTSSYCNYTGLNISDEHYNFTLGSNITVCAAGCNYTNSYSVDITRHNPTGYAFDLFRYQLCRNGNIGTQATLSTNCSTTTVTLSNAVIPLCSAGYVNYTWQNTECKGNTSFKLLVNFTGSSANSLKIVDRFVGADLFGNWTGNMTYNASSGLWLSPAFEHYLFGNRTAYFNCYYLPGAVQNASNSLNYVVNNNNPSLNFISISDYFYGERPFTNGIVSKYPLVSSINASVSCVDTDINVTSGSYANLSYKNGTFIRRDYFTSPGLTVDYGISNFTVINGIYTMTVYCIDTSNLTTVSSYDFNASNVAPSVVWLIANNTIFASAPNVTFYCYDPDYTSALGSNVQYYLSANGTLLNTSSMMPSNTTIVFNTSSLGEGTHLINVMCYDGIFNGSNSSLIYTYNELCIHDLTGLSQGLRYQDNTQLVCYSCAANQTVQDVFYSINNFAIVHPTLDNSSCANMSLELGWNRVNLTIVAGGLNSSVVYNVWAKKYDSDSFSDYAVIIFTGLITIALFIIGGYIQSKVFFFMAGTGGLIIGYEMLSMSMFAGTFVVFCSAIFSLAVLFRK